MADGGLVGCGANLAHERSELFEDVVDGFHQSRAVADQAVAAAAGETIGRARHGEALAVLLERVSRGRERSATRRGLDDDHSQAEARNDAIALATPLRRASGCG
jgi:hypothetical protein